MQPIFSLLRGIFPFYFLYTIQSPSHFFNLSFFTINLYIYIYIYQTYIDTFTRKDKLRESNTINTYKRHLCLISQKRARGLENLWGDIWARKRTNNTIEGRYLNIFALEGLHKYGADVVKQYKESAPWRLDSVWEWERERQRLWEKNKIITAAKLYILSSHPASQATVISSKGVQLHDEGKTVRKGGIVRMSEWVNECAWVWVWLIDCVCVIDSLVDCVYCVCVYVYMYVCVYVYMYIYICMYVCMPSEYVCMPDECVCIYVYVCMYVCMHVRMYVCVYVCMYMGML